VLLLLLLSSERLVSDLRVEASGLVLLLGGVVCSGSESDSTIVKDLGFEIGVEGEGFGNVEHLQMNSHLLLCQRSHWVDCRKRCIFWVPLS
jgi:hypothetical protein